MPIGSWTKKLKIQVATVIGVLAVLGSAVVGVKGIHSHRESKRDRNAAVETVNGALEKQKIKLRQDRKKSIGKILDDYSKLQSIDVCDYNAFLSATNSTKANTNELRQYQLGGRIACKYLEKLKASLNDDRIIAGLIGENSSLTGLNSTQKAQLLDEYLKSESNSKVNPKFAIPVVKDLLAKDTKTVEDNLLNAAKRSEDISYNASYLLALQKFTEKFSSIGGEISQKDTVFDQLKYVDGLIKQYSQMQAFHVPTQEELKEIEREIKAKEDKEKMSKDLATLLTQSTNTASIVSMCFPAGFSVEKSFSNPTNSLYVKCCNEYGKIGKEYFEKLLGQPTPVRVLQYAETLGYDEREQYEFLTEYNRKTLRKKYPAIMLPGEKIDLTKEIERARASLVDSYGDGTLDTQQIIYVKALEEFNSFLNDKVNLSDKNIIEQIGYVKSQIKEFEKYQNLQVQESQTKKANSKTPFSRASCRKKEKE